MDCAEEYCGSFVVSGCDGAEAFEFGEEIFYEVARAIKIGIVLAPEGSVDLGRDGDLDSSGFEDVDHPLLGIVGAIGEQRAKSADHLWQQRIGAVQIMQMTRGQMEGHRIAQRVAQGVQLGAQSALAAPDRLLRPVPPFAPALA